MALSGKERKEKIDADPTVIYVNYRSVANAHSGYMPSRVKVEVSCLSMDEPFEVKEFGTMISSVFPDDDEDAMVSIPTILPSRTHGHFLP